MNKRNMKVKRDKNEEVRQRWDSLASWWGHAMGEGDAFHRQFIFPMIEQLLPPTTAHLLDLACGTGQTTRFLASKVPEVVAADFSKAMLSVARTASATLGNIRFVEADLLDHAAWKHLRQFQADVALLSMALHDIAEVAPIAEGLLQLEQVRHLIVVVPHPAFNSPNTVRFVENHCGEEWTKIEGVKIVGYGSAYVAKVKAKAGQPTAQLVFHRPIEKLLWPFLQQGWAIDRFVEPSSYHKCGGIPQVLGVRFIRLPRVN